MANQSSPQPAPSGQRLEKIGLALDELTALQQATLAQEQPRPRGRLERKKIRLRDKLLQLIATANPGAFARLSGMRGRLVAQLSPEEIFLLAILFQQRVREPEYFISGRDLLWALSDSSWSLSKNTGLLHRSGLLRRLGLLLVYREPEDDERELLNLHFAIDTELFHGIQGTREGLSPSTMRPFSDATDYFLALTHHAELCQGRASKAFEVGLWRDLYGEPLESLSVLERRIRESWRRLEGRLALTDQADRFPLVRFRRDHLLTEAETIVVVTLLALEAFAGATSLEALDLLRVVSGSRRGLLRRRRLLSPESRLLRLGIVVPAAEDGSMAEGFTLASWVVERLLASHIGPSSKIESDERIEFHDFLAGLKGSDEFYDQL